MTRAVRLALLAPFVLSAAVAQTAPSAALSLPEALALAYRGGPDLASAQTSLQDAQTNLTARRADPGSLVTDLQSAQNAADLAAARLASARLSVLQGVVNAHLALFETQENAALLRAQGGLGARNLQVAQARLAAGSGTGLDVSRAQNAVDTTNQNLVNATAQLAVRQAELARLFGQSAAPIAASAPPSAPALPASAAALAANLETRLADLVQARQAVASAELSVRLASNDYTPRLTLASAQNDLANARRALENAQKGAATGLSDAYRAASDAQRRVSIEQGNERNARTALDQARARLQSGVISPVEVQTSEVALGNARYALVQASDAHWRALAALSVAAGQDVTGLVAPARP